MLQQNEKIYYKIGEEMKLSYKTVEHEARDELIEKKSRFIATVCPVKNEQEALSLIARMRSEFYDATHNVYAYIIGESNIMRYSDDGEPSGTAGVPVLEVIRKEGLVDVCVVVTRYFGGTLLGAGGLVRAYSASAKIGIDAAHIVDRALCDIVMAECDYTFLGKVEHAISSGGYVIKNTSYMEKARVYVYIKKDETPSFTEKIRDITNGCAKCALVGEEYVNL